MQTGATWAQQELAAEKRMIRNQVKAEFAGPVDPNDPVYKEMHNDSAAVEHVYGGQMSSLPQEGQLCKAWRPTTWGEWQLGTGVIHRVHHDDRTVTVQFVPDQGRYRCPFMSVKPIDDITPEYPTIRLKPGQRLPTPSEIEERERRANVCRETMGIGNEQALLGAESDLLAGESMGKDGMVTIRSANWGIPAPTLEVLRNRSIPSSQVTGEYGRHFYSDLYKNNFYAQQGHAVADSGHIVDEHKRRGLSKARIVSHTFIPHEGPVLEQNMITGKWHSTTPEEPQQPNHWIPEALCFLG